MAMDSRLMSLETFGRALLDTNDLDPVYVVLGQSAMDRDQMRRWCFAYWCFYHCGVASYLSEFKEHAFWDRMQIAAFNETAAPSGTRWSRGQERRHFRGANAVESVRHMRTLYPHIEHAVEALEFRAPIFLSIFDFVMEWPQFGPWISFKVADMIDRVLRVKVNFEEADVFIFDSPRDAALLWFEENYRKDLNEVLQTTMVGAALGEPATFVKIGVVTNHLASHLGSRMAPPFADRRVNIQEYETILCKWKAHRHGHYLIGNDIREIRHALTEWAPVSETADRLAQHAVELELDLDRWRANANVTGHTA